MTLGVFLDGTAKSHLRLRSHQPGPAMPTMSSWYRGHTPGRFVALLDATRAGKPVRIRATVELRGNPCRLVAWVIIPTP